MSELTDRMRYHSATLELDRPLFMEAAARIEALEAALRQIENICHDADPWAAAMATIAVARAALTE